MRAYKYDVRTTVATFRKTTILYLSFVSVANTDRDCMVIHIADRGVRMNVCGVEDAC